MYFRRIACLSLFAAGSVPRPLLLPWHGGDSGLPSSMNSCKCALSIRKRPHPQFLLPDLPKPCQASRFGNQEENDQSTNDHESQVLNCRGIKRHAEELRGKAQDDRQSPDEGSAEERAHQAAQSADDDHKQDEK